MVLIRGIDVRNATCKMADDDDEFCYQSLGLSQMGEVHHTTLSTYVSGRTTHAVSIAFALVRSISLVGLVEFVRRCDDRTTYE